MPSVTISADFTKNKPSSERRFVGGRDLSMRGMARTISVCLMVGVSLLVWGEGAGGGGGSKAPSVRLPGGAFVTLETINPEHIRWHVRYLSHDLLEGRGTGQRGGDLAAEYIATQFAEYGLKPAGDHGTYMQRVPLVGITTLYNALRQILWPLRVNRRPINVGYVDGAIMIVRRSVHGAIGGFDDQFPFSSEETDFCMRARSAGWRVVSLPTVNVIHRRGGSSARAGWSADRHAEAMLNGTRLLLQKYHGKRYTKGYFAIKQMFNGCMLCAISLLARLAHGQVRSRLVTKAAVHQAYCAQLNGIRHNLGIRESVSGVSANQCRMAKRHVRS